MVQTFGSKYTDLNIFSWKYTKAETMIVKPPCYIQTKMRRLYRKMTIYNLLSIIYIILGSVFVYVKWTNVHLWSFFCITYTISDSTFKLCYIQTIVIINSVTKEFMCNETLKSANRLWTFCLKNTLNKTCLKITNAPALLYILTSGPTQEHDPRATLIWTRTYWSR